jgi:hypothetical protein
MPSSSISASPIVIQESSEFRTFHLTILSSQTKRSASQNAQELSDVPGGLASRQVLGPSAYSAPGARLTAAYRVASGSGTWLINDLSDCFIVIKGAPDLCFPALLARSNTTHSLL